MKELTVDLREVSSAARAEVEQAKKVAPTVGEREPLTPREINFTLQYDGPDGKDHVTALKSRVLDADGRLAKMRVFATLTRGLSVEQLTTEDHYRVDALSRLSVQLLDPPAWVLEAAGMDLELLIHLNNILVEHETRYFRGNTSKGEGDSKKERVRTAVPAFEQKGATP